MRTLIRVAFKHSRHFALLGVTLFSMLVLVLSSQMEILTTGFIIQKGPSFFELFGPVEEGFLIEQESVSHDQLEKRWNELEQGNSGVVTKDDTREFLQSVRREGFLNRILYQLEEFIPLTGNLKNLAFLVAGIAIFKAFALFWYSYSTKIIAIKMSRDLRQRYFEHLQILPMEFYQKYNIGSLSTRVVTDSLMIADGINALLINYIKTPFTVISTLILCFLTSWEMSVITFIGFPLIVYPIVFLAKKIKKIAKQLQKNQENFASVLIDYLSGIQTVKAFSMEDFSLKKYNEQNHEMARLERKSARYDVLTRPIVHTIGMILLASALLYGLYALNMSIAEVLVYCGLLIVFYEPLKKLAEENARILKGAAAAERMDEVLSIEPKIKDSPDATDIKEFKSELGFNNLSFRYGAEDVLKNLNFTIKCGETIGVCGPTGSGKSTLVQLLPRLYDPSSGTISIDGKALQKYTISSLRQLISFVPQKPFLFLDTVAENLSYGRNYTRDEIIDAAKQAHADEFIQELPSGYDTLLDEGGKNLSGGQQQRLAIARALLKKAPILVLDEATSALDAISEDKIKTAISELHGKVTQIIIAHRLTTIEDADRIIYMEQGEIIAMGSKDELLKECTGFRAMWEMMHRKKESANV